MFKPSEILSAATTAYANKDVSTLKRLFTMYLRESYDISFWNIYIQFVTNFSEKQVDLADVYSFVLNHFENGYENYSLIKSAIASIVNGKSSSSGNSINFVSLDDPLKVERIRKIFQQFLKLPGNHLSPLWTEYEEWENSVNRMTASSNIDSVLPFYSNAQRVYERLLPSVRSCYGVDTFNNNSSGTVKLTNSTPDKSIFKIIDIELENPLKLSKKSFEVRLNFHFNSLCSAAPDKYCDAIRVLQSFYLPSIQKNISAPIVSAKHPKTLLTYWFSFQLKQNLFDFSDNANYDLTCINYLKWLVQNEGLEAFREKFKQMRMAQLDGGEETSIEGKPGEAAPVEDSSTQLKDSYSADTQKEVYPTTSAPSKDSLIRLNHRRLSPYVYMAAADIEYANNFPENAYSLLIDAHSTFLAEAERNEGESSSSYRIYLKDVLMISEFALDMFIASPSVKHLFIKLTKTTKMWNLMIRHEQIHGDFEEYKRLILEKQAWELSQQSNSNFSKKSALVFNQSSILASHNNLSAVRNDSTSFGIYLTIRDSFTYKDLCVKSQCNSAVLVEFLNRLPDIPENENIFSLLQTSVIVELLQGVNV